MIPCTVCFIPLPGDAFADHMSYHRANGQHAPYCAALLPAQTTVDTRFDGTAVAIPGPPAPCSCPMSAYH